MEELKIKKQLRAYLENQLDLEDYDAFFDTLNKIDSVILNQWINEILGSEVKVYNEERIIKLVNFDALQKKLNDQILSEHDFQRSINNRSRIIRWIGCAAAILIVVGFATHLLKPQNSASQVYLFENNYAYNISALLPDSSTVILFPKTKISYTLNRATDTREIAHLKGKVLYKVKKSTKPFKVNYKDYTTSALGTKFIVDAVIYQYPQIKLLEGKISVSHNLNKKNEYIILEKDGIVNIDLSKGIISKHLPIIASAKNIDRIAENKHHVTAELKGKVNWSSNLLEVNQIQSLEIFKLLEHIYDVTILTENSDLLNYKFTGSINIEQRIDDFLKNYCELNECTYTNKDQIIVINTNQRKEAFR